MSTITTPFRSPDAPAETSPNGTAPNACKPAVMTITPQIAQEWATLNTRNRPVRYAKVAQFARDMKAGRWHMTGDPIQFGISGRLLNGQHRLWACIMSDTAFETVVV